MISSKHIITLQKMIGEWLDIATCRSALENCGGKHQKAVQWLIENELIEYVKMENDAVMIAIPAGYSELFKGATAYMELDDIIFCNRIGRRFPAWKSDMLRIRIMRNCLKQFSRIKGLAKKCPLKNVDIEIIENAAALFHYNLASILPLPDLKLVKACFCHIPTQMTVELFVRQ